MTGKSVLIALASGLLLMSASGAWADETVPQQQATAQAGQMATGGPEGLRAAPHLRVAKRQIAPDGIRSQYVNAFNGYTPSQIRDAYGFSSLQAGNDGTGQTIAIVDAYGSPTITDDLAQFCSQFGLSPATLTIHYMDGEDGSKTSYDAGWAFETSLDVEWVNALAPGATILLVVAQSNYLTDLFAAVHYAAQHAQVVSMSWGGSEFSTEGSYNSYFQHAGTVFVASSGDNGSGPQYPAACPRVLAAGGTTLYLQSGTGILKFPEVAWEDSGGGRSGLYTRPAYQANFGINLAATRCIPDVAFNADPYTGVQVYDSNYDPSTGNWWIVGGTSLSAPCWAAIIALADQLRAAAQPELAPLTDGHHALYTLAGSHANYNAQGCYKDITWGYNGNWAAGTGYDLVTGLGSPVVGTLVPALGTFNK